MINDNTFLNQLDLTSSDESESLENLLSEKRFYLVELKKELIYSIFNIKKWETLNWYTILDIDFWTEECSTKIKYLNWDNVENTTRLFFLKKIWKDNKELEDRYREYLKNTENEIEGIKKDIKIQKKLGEPKLEKVQDTQNIMDKEPILPLLSIIKYKIETVLIDAWLFISDKVKFLSESIEHRIVNILKEAKH